MNSLKTHLSVIISLVALLFSLEFSFFMNYVIKSYENIMQNEYSIVLVAKKEINLSNFEEVSNLKEINPQNMLKNLENKVSKDAILKVSQNLPKFYSVNLSFFPDEKELNFIAQKLQKVDGVSKVEIFAKSYNNMYKMLILVKNIVYLFSILTLILSIMLILRQMKIWTFEHKSRIDIMILFGATYFTKSMILHKIAFIDGLISAIFVIGFFWFLPNFEFYKHFISSIGIPLENFITSDHIFTIFGVSLFVSFVSVILVMLGIKEENL